MSVLSEKHPRSTKQQTPLIKSIMQKRIITYIISFLACTTIHAQKLLAPTPVYDCGQVMFRTPITTNFVVKNKTSKQIKITDIQTSCGCTTATADNTTIPGGKEIIVKATFDAKQLGHFQKDIWIYVDGQKKPLELTMKGVVVTHIKDYSGTYPYLLGQIRADKNEIEFDDVNQGSMPTQTIHILNVSGSTAEPVIMHLPDYILAEVSPSRLAPDQGGEIRLILLTSKLRNYGLTQTNLYLGKQPGDKIAAEKEIPVSAILLPTVNKSDENIFTSPKIQLSATSIDRKEMSGKPDKLKGEIVIQNTGHSELEISSLQMFTTGLQVSLGKTVIKPSETTKLKIQVDDNQVKSLKQRPRILMITNDPNNPKVIVEIL